MPWTAHQYQTPHGISPDTVLNESVSADGTPGGNPYGVPLTGWQRKAVPVGTNVLTRYTNEAAGFTHERYALDQGPYLLTVQSWVPDRNLERPDGRTDPAAAGLASPDLRWESTYYRRGSGSDSTPFVGAPGVTRTPYGWQDGASWEQFQDQGEALAAYGTRPLTRTSTDASVPLEMPDTMRALPPQPAGGWTSLPVNSIGQEVMTGYIDNAKYAQQATAQEFTANSANIGSTMLTRMRTVNTGAMAGPVGGIPGGRWTGGGG